MTEVEQQIAVETENEASSPTMPAAELTPNTETGVITDSTDIYLHPVTSALVGSVDAGELDELIGKAGGNPHVIATLLMEKTLESDQTEEIV